MFKQLFSMRMVGSLSNDVPITLGNHRNEAGEPVEGRRDFSIDGAPRFEQHFQGDITKESIANVFVE